MTYLPCTPAGHANRRAHESSSDRSHTLLQVLVVNHEFPPVGGGASAVTYELASGYAKRGHAVSVVTMRYDGLPEHERKDGVEIYRVRCVRRRKDMCTVPEMLTFVISARRFLSRHLRTRTYDINHTHFVVPSGAIALWAKRTFGLPYILTAHGSDVLWYNPRFRFVYPLVSRAWMQIVREAKIITSPSSALARLIRALNERLPVITIRNGIDPDRFVGTTAKENRILVVSRLVRAKGVQDVLDALRGLELRGWKVDIVGDGPYRRALEQSAVRYKLLDYVTFHGWIDHNSDHMLELYSRARIFVSASHRENMSMSLLEALAARCWIVASNVGGTPEVVEPGSLFPGRNVCALREKLASTMVAADARATPPVLSDDFHWGGVVRQYEELCLQ
jgi:glycosyltransferase involved in cell wall biosynthesis